MGEWRCKRCGQTFEEGTCPAIELERAVIEAAKFEVESRKKYWAVSLNIEIGLTQVLVDAVEALLEVKGS